MLCCRAEAPGNTGPLSGIAYLERFMSRRALALFIAMSVIWGIPYLFIRIAVSELPPAVLVFGRTGVAALILVPIALYRRELRGLASHWLPLVMYTAVEIGV